MRVVTSNGEITTSFEGSVEEYREYLQIEQGEDVEDTCEDTSQELFSVTFRDCNGEVASKTITGERAVYLDDVLRAFMEAYNASGFVNDLTITLHNSYRGDTVITSKTNKED
jgi:hypothetical protein